MNKPKEFKLGWLSPDGELIECHNFDHISSPVKFAISLVILILMQEEMRLMMFCLLMDGYI